MIVEYIDAHREFGVDPICRVLTEQSRRADRPVFLARRQDVRNGV